MSVQTIKTYQDLIVWQKSIVLINDVYRITKTFPSEEKFGIVSQIRRSTISIASNIAEGYGRGSRKDYTRFIQIANGSLFEAQTQIIICRNLGYLKEEEYNDLFNKTKELDRMFSSLIRKLKNQ